MPSFTVEHNTKLSPEDAYSKVSQYLQNSESLKKLDANLQCRFDEKSKTGHVKSSKFECNLKILGSDPTKVQLHVSISLFLAPFKGTIEKNLKDKMIKILG